MTLAPGISNTVAALILAAGESRRMGEDKALLRLGKRTFLGAILQKVRVAGIGRSLVVLGHNAAEIERAVDLQGARVVLNPDYRYGQTSSLQAGLRVLRSARGASLGGVLVCLVDHPAFETGTVRQLLGGFVETRAPLVIPSFRSHRGHPVIIGRTLFLPLLGLHPEQGANSLLRKYRHAAHYVPVHDPGVLLDVDRPADYRRLPVA